MKDKKIYSVIHYNKEENCIERVISYDSIELAKSRAIIWSYHMIENENLWIFLNDLQDKWFLDDPCIARDFTDKNWYYCFDRENVVRIEIVENYLYFNQSENV